MLRPWYIAVLEVKRFVVDPGRLAFSLALPIVLFALMYGAFSEAGQFNGTAHLVDLDEGPMARELIARLERVDGLQVKLHTSADADQALDRANILAVAVIPDGFSEGLTAGSPVSITFKQLGSGGAEGQIAASIVQSAALELAGEAQVRAQVRDALKETALDDAKIDETVASLLDQARENPMVTVKSRAIGGQSDPLSRLLPGIMTMFLLFSVTLGATTLVEERRIGTLERLLTTRLSIDQLFLGKFPCRRFDCRAPGPHPAGARLPRPPGRRRHRVRRGYGLRAADNGSRQRRRLGDRIARPDSRPGKLDSRFLHDGDDRFCRHLLRRRRFGATRRHQQVHSEQVLDRRSGGHRRRRRTRPTGLRGGCLDRHRDRRPYRGAICVSR